MKRGVIWIALTILMVTSLVLASCSTSTTTNTSTTTSLSPTTTTTITTTATGTISTSTSVVTTAVTTTSTGNWWDSLGTPTYGGTLTIYLPNSITGWDDYGNIGGGQSIMQAYQDALVADDWTLNPSVFAYNLAFRPNTFEVGDMASDWEFTGPTTYVVHIRPGIMYQNIAPVNGREFTSADVVYHYDRILGLGDGFTAPSPYFATVSAWLALKSVVANDKYTVTFNWSGVSQESICETCQGGGSDEYFEAQEAVNLWGNLQDWHHAIGTGPFILTDYVDGAAATLVRNPNYWAHDERYPQNQIPYISGLKVLIIANLATAQAAVRAGKLDVIDTLTLQQAQQMTKTNSDLLQLTYPGGPATVDPKNDVKPFTDIRVRQAMQEALNLPQIASAFYQGTASASPSTMTSMYMTGWTYPYSQWPVSLQQAYAYNPTNAKALLAAAGYPNGFTTDIVTANNSDLDLLQIIQSEFAAVGITMNINVYDYATWNTMVRAKKHDQLAYNNSAGFTFPPLMGFRRFQSTSGNNWCDVVDPSWDALYAQALAATTVAQTQALVVQGNQYEAAQQWLITLPTTSNFSVYQPWLKGYNGQEFSISGSSGVLWIGFYCARFWIDENLKQSLGYGS